jgi:general secretion pathway protein J
MSAARASGFNPATPLRGVAFSRAGGSAAKAHGFTLVEILLATVLLAAALALAFATLRASTATVQRGEAMAQRSEHMRAVDGFLRARLAGARFQGFELDSASGLPLRFFGEESRMRFVADLPDYLGHGGPYVHELFAVDGGDGVRLLLGLRVQQPLDATMPLDPGEQRPPELLAEGLQSVRFRYRALDADGRLGEWQAQWPTPERLPLQVEIAIRDGRGEDWPMLLVALPMGASLGPATASGPGLRR